MLVSKFEEIRMQEEETFDVTPPKLTLANPVESLAIPQLNLRVVKQVITLVKTCQSNARKVNKSESTTIHQVRTWSY
jgi:hypothetical protein